MALPPEIPLRESLPNSWRAMRDPIGIFSQYNRAYGHNFLLRLGGVTRALISTDPEVVQHVLQRNHRNYHKSAIQSEQLAYYLGKGLLTNDGDDWLRQRRLIQPGFHRERIAGLCALMHEVAQGTFQALAQKGDTTIDVYPVMMDTAFGIMAYTLFSEGIAQGERQRLGDIITELQDFIVKPIRLPFLRPWYRISGQIGKHEKMAKEAFSTLARLIAIRRNSGRLRNDLLQMLLDTRYEDTGEPMADRQLLEEVIVLLVAGHETSANALAWTLHLLATHPEVQHRLYEEIIRILPAADDAPTPDNLRQAVYLTQVIEESLRLYPPAWITDRVALADDGAAGISWPKGTLMTPYIYGLHHHPDFWEQPERFDPDRMHPDRKKERPAGAYIPFGAGPRLCIGYSFAMMEMQVVLAMMARQFVLTPAPGAAPRAKALITLRPDPGVTLKLSVRSQ